MLSDLCPFALCPLPSAAYPLPSAAYPLLPALCSLLSALCPLQFALCSLQHAECSMQHAQQRRTGAVSPPWTAPSAVSWACGYAATCEGTSQRHVRSDEVGGWLGVGLGVCVGVCGVRGVGVVVRGRLWWGRAGGREQSSGAFMRRDEGRWQQYDGGGGQSGKQARRDERARQSGERGHLRHGVPGLALAEHRARRRHWSRRARRCQRLNPRGTHASHVATKRGRSAGPHQVHQASLQVGAARKLENARGYEAAVLVRGGVAEVEFCAGQRREVGQ